MGAANSSFLQGLMVVYSKEVILTDHMPELDLGSSFHTMGHPGSLLSYALNKQRHYASSCEQIRNSSLHPDFMLSLCETTIQLCWLCA